jgi:hypothetical protein
MKPILLHPLSTFTGVALAGLALLATGAQSPTRLAEIPATRCGVGFQPPVPVEKLEYFSVLNYAGRALAGDIVQVAHGERLIVLGKNPTVKGLGSLSRGSAFKLPLIEETYAENLIAPGDTNYILAGVPAAFFDEGSYVFAEYGGLEDPTPRIEHARALIGYRVRLEE